MLNANAMPIRHQGNDNLFLAVEMSLLSTLAGTPLHIHAEGLRGTGKTTVMRWAKANLPRIPRVRNCPYYCDPSAPHCPLHAGGKIGQEDGNPSAPPAEETAMPFIEVGHGAKLGTILGSIDLSRLTDPRSPEAALLPGSIPMANRGVLFVDEINRLAETAPEITDVLLSVMGTKPGRIRIEEVGLPPCEIEICASVWAASNPDEEPGPLDEIRKQLSDRFDLVVAVQRPSEPAVVESLLSLKTSGETFLAPPGNPAMAGLEARAMRLKDVRVPQEILKYMAHLYVHRNVESLRAIESLELSARLAAAMRDADQVSLDEVLTVIPMVLRHRVDPLTLSEILKDLELRKAAGTQVKNPLTRPGGPNPADVTVLDEERQNAGGHGTGESGSHEAASGQTEPLPPEVSPWQRRTPDSVVPPSFFKRFLSRCRNLFDGGGRRSSLSGRRSPLTGGYPPDPMLHRLPGQGQGISSRQTSVQPVSPPDAAQRIGYLPSDELVTAPDWKDHRR